APAATEELGGQRPAQAAGAAGDQGDPAPGGRVRGCIARCHAVTILVEVSFMSRASMKDTDLLAIGEVARRAGFATSAVRFYEREGLLAAVPPAGGQRRDPRSARRRLAFIRAAQNVGLSLEEIRDALATLPAGRTPTKED